ncbi:hypothetical protein ACK37A_09325 [Aeromonas veronii]
MAISDTFSGESTYIYSSRIVNFHGIKNANKKLMSSGLFLMSLDSNGLLSYKKNGKLIYDKLKIELTLNEQGMRVENHNNYINSNTEKTFHYAFFTAINLLLSEKRFFNEGFSFPLPKTRFFMMPVFIQAKDNDEGELFFPIVTIYEDGTIQLSFKSFLGFHEANKGQLIKEIANKSQLNIKSFCCTQEVFLSLIGYEYSKQGFTERLKNKRFFNNFIARSFKKPFEFDFLDDNLQLFNLIKTDIITITDIARNILSFLGSSIENNTVIKAPRLLGKKRSDGSLGFFWSSKPVILVSHHSRQMSNASANWNAHRTLVNAVMQRTTYFKSIQKTLIEINDVRPFDDFNHFYSDSISFVMMSKNATRSVEEHPTYNIQNVASDIISLNEIAEYIKTYYCCAEKKIDNCNSTIDVVNEKLELSKFESSLMAAHKYGEIAIFIEHVMSGKFVANSIKNTEKKLESIVTLLELNERISSEKYNNKIAMFFGFIASASLSPEFVQPLLRIIGFDSILDQEPQLKIVSFIISIATVFIAFKLINRSSK